MDNIIEMVASNANAIKRETMEEDVEYLPKKRGRKTKLMPDASIDEYSISDIEKFIELVEERPYLWDSVNELSLKNIDITRAWSEVEQICGQFVKQARISGKNAQFLWSKLRREFKKEHDIQKGEMNFPIGFKFYKHMLFLVDNSRKNEMIFMRAPSEVVELPMSSRKIETLEELVEIARDSNNHLRKIAACQEKEDNSRKNEDLHELLDEVLEKLPMIDRNLMKSRITQFVISSYQEYQAEHRGNQLVTTLLKNEL
ncbi:unnamed protein product [Caenorhabditis angaria]|uniref:MADF domain-containing protein n=1 Tax=Caenorhabditis angaria TaxID=860376 RepID=A0A9P1IKM4_9PELO|nr:unnamed protein product [Caenorhabditis angaria]